MGFTLKDVREKFGISARDVSERTGISIAGLSAMERNGTVPAQTTCKKMAKAYGIPSFIIRSIAVLSSEDRPDAGPQRDRYDEMVRLCVEAVSQRVNGRKK